MHSKTYRVLFALILIILGALVSGVLFGWTSPLDYINNSLLHSNDKVILGFIALFSIVIGFSILRGSFKQKISTQTNIIETKLGEIKITIKALENMTEKIAKKIVGIKEAKTKIKSTPNGIAVFIEISVTSDVNIPEITTETQNKINEYFLNQAGIQVEEVRILVSDLAKDVKSRVE
ncbi:hypothetical protein SAMN00017405_0284 [Desulfonispora thiosulfatigenes DSM 11270]|uniref:Alkaline shock response membrane anchor protein AmaP n=1 Tax=Desulfonispora thiosulfatigenes DSM 11270 TaxID=656914 RepID=A0A1W1VNG0_DESTI|nr:alkaline shock response membrane anchor protein AmaP [Desulfonispora thiosulfatigenes]SMB94858.1 hypothetical protein SAMN00017405_0284 [Desulfonispora thiosulfatigenes DSM 11270]